MDKFSLENENRETHERESRDLGVIFSVEGEAKAEVDRLVRLIEARAELISRVDESHLPHISLFQGRMPGVQDTVSLEKVISELYEEFELSEIEMEDGLFVRPNGNIFWNVKPNENLARIHLKLLEKLQPLTEGLLMPQFRKILDKEGISAGDREQILQYGCLLAGPTFLPHITLGKLKRFTDKEKLEDIRPQLRVVQIKQPSIYELNEDGSLKVSTH